MNSTNRETSPRTAFQQGGFAGAPFFYSNLRIQENVTTVRYGVETRRGMILIVGDPGTGKTTLLGKALSELPAHIDVVVIPPGTQGFADVLQMLLSRLETSDASDIQNDPTLAGSYDDAVRRCQFLLRTRLQRNELVALAIDDAHLLPERTLRNLIHNFLGGTAEAPESALLQMILAGNPALKSKLNQAALIPLRRRRPVICQVQALGSHETAAYIQQGLSAAHRPENLFDERAIKRIALLSGGNPRSIGDLCRHALELAGEGGVTAELIDAAARKLEVGARHRPRGAASDETIGIFAEEAEEEDGRADRPEFALGRASLADEPAFFEPHGERFRFAWLPQGGRLASWLRGMTLVTVLAAAAALIPAEPAVELLTSWRTRVVELAAGGDNSPPREDPAGEDRPRIEKRTPAPPAMPDPMAANSEPGQPDGAAPKAAPVDNPAAAPGRAETPNAGRDRAPFEAEPEARSQTPRLPEKPPAARQREIQLEVAKAIASRAIMGVQVSVVQGTAILEGRVASERQRRAAERAALSVTGVERVRNRIAITYG